VKFETIEDEFGTKIVLWRNTRFIIVTPKNPHLPESEGCHIIVFPVKHVEKGWEALDLAGETFKLALQVAKILVDEKIVDWANLQYNDNWRGAKTGKAWFHLHVYGRKRSGTTWGQPVVLPKTPKSFKNKPLSGPLLRRISALLSKRLR